MPFLFGDGTIRVGKYEYYGCEQFTTSTDLWAYLSNMVEPNLKIDENKILFLFNSSELLIENAIYRGDYTYKRKDLIKILASSEGINKKVGKGEVKLSIPFIVKK